MTDDVEVTDQVDNNAQGNEEAEFIDDNDPMLAALKEAEAESAGQAKAEADKKEEAPAQTKADAAKPEEKSTPVMIPKARLDEVLAERDRLKEALTYSQGIVDTQSQMIKGGVAKPAAAQDQNGKTEVPATETVDVIAKAEADKLALTQKYEDGEITALEWKKQEIELDRLIRAEADKQTQSLVEKAQKTVSDTLTADKIQSLKNAEAVERAKEHPYVAEIDKLPPKIRDGVWDQINDEAAVTVAAKGIRPGTATYELEMIRERANLTDKYGPQFTGKQLSSPKPGTASETAQQRAAKLEMAENQPPAFQGNGATEKRELTESDINKMTQDQLADMLLSAPAIVLKAAGISNR